MAMLTQDNAWYPEDYGKLVDAELDSKGVAFRVGTVVTTGRNSLSFPRWLSDPDTSWYSENEQISLSDGSTDEVVVTPKKAAGLTQASNEAVQDSDPAVAEQIGRGLARQISESVDAAFFADSTAKGPEGLLSVGYTTVDMAAAPMNLDPFHQAKSDAATSGAELNVFVLAPDVALALAQAKTGQGSNESLLDSVSDGDQVAGVPVLISRHVAAGEAWGIDSSQVMTVRRTPTEIATSTAAAFDFDAVQIRATARVAFGFVNPAGLIRLHSVAS